MNKTIRLLAILILFSLFTTLFSACEEGVMTVSTKELSITIADDFQQTPHIYYVASYEKENGDAVLIVRESKAVVEDVAGHADVTREEYAALLISSNKKGSDPREEDGILYYTYTAADDSGVDYTYLSTVFTSENAFWMVQFVTKTANFNDRFDTFMTYAGSVSFNENYETA